MESVRNGHIPTEGSSVRERALQMTKSYNPQKTENKLYKPPFSDVRFKRPSIQSTAVLYTQPARNKTPVYSVSVPITNRKTAQIMTRFKESTS